MTAQDILDAFNARLQTFPGLPDVAWEGEAYEPLAGRPYLSPRLSSYVGTGVGAGTGGTEQHDGTYTITVRRPADEGRAPAGQMAAALKAYFARDKALFTAAGLPVVLMQSTEQPATYYGNWVSIPVVVTFSALV